ncbi:hypothetical protein ACNIRR_26695, partial [Escherichia coli]
FTGVEIREERTRRRIAAVASWQEHRCPKPEGVLGILPDAA